MENGILYWWISDKNQDVAYGCAGYRGWMQKTRFPEFISQLPYWFHPWKIRLVWTSGATSKALKDRHKGTSWDGYTIRLWSPPEDMLTKCYTPRSGYRINDGCGCNRGETASPASVAGARAFCTSWQSDPSLPCPLPLWVAAHLFRPGCSTKLRCRMTALNHSTLRMAPVGPTGSSTCLIASA